MQQRERAIILLLIAIGMFVVGTTLVVSAGLDTASETWLLVGGFLWLYSLPVGAAAVAWLIWAVLVHERKHVS
jgi:hypothetical protein